MASSGWQGRKLITSWGSYSSIYLDLDVQSISHTGSTVTVSGQYGLTYKNSAGGTGTYNYTIVATPQTGSAVSFSTWSNQKDEYYQLRSFSATFTASNDSTSATFNTKLTTNGGFADKTISWTLSFDKSGSGPSGISASLVSATPTEIKVKTDISNWGTATGSLEGIVVADGATSSNWESIGRIVKATTTTAKTVTSTLNNTDTSISKYSGGLTIKGAMPFYVAGWANTQYGSAGGFNSTRRYTPPTKPTISSVTQANTNTGVNVTIKAVGGSSSVNASNQVTTQYSYLVGTGSYSEWTSMGSGLPWESKSVTISSVYDTSMTVRVRQVYNGAASEVVSTTFNTNASVAPSGGTVSSTAVTANSITLKGSISSFGTPSGNSDRVVKLAIAPTLNAPTTNRGESLGTATSGTVTITNNSGHLFSKEATINPADRYYAYIHAYNGWTSSIVWNNTPIYTKPAKGSVSYSMDKAGLCSITYTTASSNAGTDQGGLSTVKMRYKINSGSWVEETYSVDLSSARTVSTYSPFTINEGDTVTVEAWTTYRGLQSEVSTTSFKRTASFHPKFYGSVNGKTKQITSFYGSVDGKTKEVYAIYGSIGGTSKKIYEKVLARTGTGQATALTIGPAYGDDVAVISGELDVDVHISGSVLSMYTYCKNEPLHFDMRLFITEAIVNSMTIPAKIVLHIGGDTYRITLAAKPKAGQAYKIMLDELASGNYGISSFTETR